jgi:hypothetical protein
VGHLSTTGFTKAAGVLLMVFGILLGLFGLVFIAVGAAAGDLSDSFYFGVDANTVRNLVTGIGVVFVVFALIQVFGGIGSWRGSGWGRVIGLVYGVLGTLFALASFGGSSSAAANRSVGFSIAILAVYGFITLALAFRWKSPTR